MLVIQGGFFRCLYTHSAVGDVLGNAENEEQPGFGVAEALADLVPFDLFVFDARVVAFDALEADELLAVAHVPALRGRVGEEQEDDAGPDEGDAAEDEVEQPPAGEGCVRVSDAVTDYAGENG